MVTLVLQRHAHSMPQARRDLRGVRTSSEMFIALESVVARSCAASLRVEQQWTSDASEWPGPSSAARRSWMRCAGVQECMRWLAAARIPRAGRAEQQSSRAAHSTQHSHRDARCSVSVGILWAPLMQQQEAGPGPAQAGAGQESCVQPAAHHWRGGHECWRQRRAQRTPPQSQTRRQSGPSRSLMSRGSARSAILSHHLTLHRLPLPIAAARDPRTAGQGRQDRAGQGRPKRL